MNILRSAMRLAALVAVLGFASVEAPASAASAEPVTVRMLVVVARSSPESWDVAMNLVRHVIRFQGIDHSRLELLAFGPGLKMLLKGTRFQGDIQSFTQYGVTFAVCRRNLAAAHIPISQVADDVHIIGDAVVEIQRRRQQGWVIAWP